MVSRTARTSRARLGWLPALALLLAAPAARADFRAGLAALFGRDRPQVVRNHEKGLELQDQAMEAYARQRRGNAAWHSECFIVYRNGAKALPDPTAREKASLTVKVPGAGTVAIKNTPLRMDQVFVERRGGRLVCVEYVEHKAVKVAVLNGAEEYARREASKRAADQWYRFETLLRRNSAEVGIKVDGTFIPLVRQGNGRTVFYAVGTPYVASQTGVARLGQAVRAFFSPTRSAGARPEEWVTWDGDDGPLHIFEMTLVRTR